MVLFGGQPFTSNFTTQSTASSRDFQRFKKKTVAEDAKKETCTTYHAKKIHSSPPSSLQRTSIFSLPCAKWRDLDTTGNHPCKRAHHISVNFGGIEANLNSVNHQQTVENQRAPMSIPGYVVIHGGTCLERNIMLGDTYYLHVDSAIWTRARTTPRSGPIRAFHTGNLFDCRLIIFGGTDGAEIFNTVHVLDLVTMKWEQLEPNYYLKDDEKSPIPPPRMAHTSAIVEVEGGRGGLLVVIGGHNPNMGQNHGFDDIWTLDLQSRVWTQHLAPSPSSDLALHESSNSKYKSKNDQHQKQELGRIPPHFGSSLTLVNTSSMISMTGLTSLHSSQKKMFTAHTLILAGGMRPQVISSTSLSSSSSSSCSSSSSSSSLIAITFTLSCSL